MKCKLAKRIILLGPVASEIVMVGVFAPAVILGLEGLANREVVRGLAGALVLTGLCCYVPVLAATRELWDDAKKRADVGPGIEHREVVRQLITVGSEQALLRLGKFACWAFGLLLASICTLLWQYLPLSFRAAAPQLLANGFIAGSLYALIALSFSLVYSTCRFFHFAHGAVLTVGAYLAYVFIRWYGQNPYLGITESVASMCALGALMELGVYRPLRRKNASAVGLLLASLGIFVAIQGVISLVFGDDVRILRSGPIVEGIHLFGARITAVRAGILIMAILLTTLMVYSLTFTRMGRMIRAVANDSELASIVGVRSESVILVVLVVGSGLAAIAGICMGYDADLVPLMGLRGLLMGVTAAVVGGIGSSAGALFGALLIGLGQQLVSWWMPSQWQDAAVFAILIVFLLVQPQGFFGKAGIKAAA